MNGRQLALELSTRFAYGREDFLVAPCNSDAVAWIDRWPVWPGGMLAIYGSPGCGKTHLTQVWREVANAQLVELSSLEDLTRDVQLSKNTADFVLEIDETSFLERDLLHFLNTIADQQRTILITGRNPPARWPVELPDLRSRLRAVSAVGVSPPDENTLRAVLVKLFSDRQLKVGEELIEFLCARIERTFDSARKTVVALDAAAMLAQRRIGIPLAREVLSFNGK